MNLSRIVITAGLAIIYLGCSSVSAQPAPASDPDSGIPAEDAGADHATPQPKNPDTCDTVAQDCVKPSAARCTILDSRPYYTACVGPIGTKKAGDPCTVNVETGDDCGKGLFCTINGNTAAPTCAKLCHAGTDCGTGEACVNIQYKNSLADFKDGVCRVKCLPYSTTCGATETCGWIVLTPDRYVAFLCKPSGPKVAGDACLFDDECGANLGCNRTCTPLCDDTHACATGACKDGFCQ